jgi:hypothetical protein
MFTSLFLYQNFSSLVNTAQGAWFRPQTDFEVQANAVGTEIWKFLTNKAEKSQQEKDYLRPFLKTKNIIVATQNNFYGIVTPPKEYERFSSARLIIHKEKTLPDKSIDNGKCCNADIFKQEEINDEYYKNISQSEIDLIDDKNWAACLQHKKKYPTLEKPKMLQIEGGFRVAPKGVSVVVLDYYILPKYATFKYTISPGNEQTGAGDDIVFDTSSQPFEWPVTVLPEFLWRLAQRYGIFIEKELIFNFATQQRQTNLQ